AGQMIEARRLADRLRPAGGPFLGVVAYVYGATGDPAAALGIAHEMEVKRPIPWFGEWTVACAYLGVKDTARALDALERSTAAGEIWPTFNPLAVPMYDPLRRSARFRALV